MNAFEEWFGEKVFSTFFTLKLIKLSLSSLMSWFHEIHSKIYCIITEIINKSFCSYLTVIEKKLPTFRRGTFQ